MNEKGSLEDILTLVEQNFEFLHVGLFLSNYYIKAQNLSVAAKNLQFELPGNKRYLLNGVVIRDFLSMSFINWDKPNVLGYLVEWNAFRGIAMAMYEGVKNRRFEDFLIGALGEEKKRNFCYIIEFIRNVLSHSIENEIKLVDKNFDGTKRKFLKHVNKSGVASFDFVYSRDFPEKINSPADYGFGIEIRFSDLKEGDRFIDIVSEWQLFMIMELCFNLVKYCRQMPNNYSPA